MKQIVVCAFLILGVINSSYSQNVKYQKPDYDQIKEVIQDSSSSFYYPQLMERFELADTTLTDEDYYHLYYGYLFQEDYKPYMISTEEKELIPYYQSKNLKEKDYNKIIKLATSAISKFPFDLRQMNFLAFVYHLKGDETMAMQTANKFNNIVRVILSSGDGKTCKTGYHVISVSHEYVILNTFEAVPQEQFLEDGCDFFKLKNKKGIYFDIRQFFGKGF
jgi:hypothetical protein